MNEKTTIADNGAQPLHGGSVRIHPALLVPMLAEILREGKEVPLAVSGNSMQPFLEHGRDFVTVSPVSGEVRRGDIVLFRDPTGRYLMHRVIRLREGKVITWGDGNMRPDPAWDPESVLGVVRSAKRKGKFITERSRSWRAWRSLWGLHPILRRPLLWLYRIATTNALRDAA